MRIRQRAFPRLVQLAWLTALVVWPWNAASAEEPVTVLAAASLKEAVETIAAAWKSDTGHDVRLSLAGSSALAKQIEEGVPADLFISADQRWMDYLDSQELIDGQSRVDLLANRIVLIAPATSTVELQIAPGFALSERLGNERLAMANVDAVPAGVYGKAALESLGVWDSVKDKVAQAENVRAALLLVSRDEAPLGIVYETDARVDPGVRILDRFPEGSHPPIIYPAAVLAESQNPLARAFLTYLQSQKAHDIFTAQGFAVLAQTH